MNDRTPRRRTPQSATSRPTSRSTRPGRPLSRGGGVRAGTPPSGRARSSDRRGESRAPSTATFRRRRLVVIGAGAIVMVAVIVVVVGLVRAMAGDGPAAGSAPSMAPKPTPTPIARTDASAFAAALPATVLGFALLSQVPEETLVTEGALESYSCVYGDGTDDAATTVVVIAGQWPTAKEASATATELRAELGAPAKSGPVMVQGRDVGTFVIVRGGNGSATALWTNETALLSMTGPADVVQDLYAAFSL